MQQGLRCFSGKCLSLRNDNLTEKTYEDKFKLRTHFAPGNKQFG